jgi:hypothetical protein
MSTSTSSRTFGRVIIIVGSPFLPGSTRPG